MEKQRGSSRSWRIRGSTEAGPGGCQSTLPVFIYTFNIFKTLHYTPPWRPDWKRKGLPQQIFMYLFVWPPLPTFIHNKCDPAAVPAHSRGERGLFPPEPCCSPGRAEPSTAHTEHPTLLLPKVLPLTHSQNRPRPPLPCFGQEAGGSMGEGQEPAGNAARCSLGTIIFLVLPRPDLYNSQLWQETDEATDWTIWFCQCNKAEVLDFSHTCHCFSPAAKPSFEGPQTSWIL